MKKKKMDESNHSTVETSLKINRVGIVREIKINLGCLVAHN